MKRCETFDFYLLSMLEVGYITYETQIDIHLIFHGEVFLIASRNHWYSKEILKLLNRNLRVNDFEFDRNGDRITFEVYYPRESE